MEPKTTTAFARQLRESWESPIGTLRWDRLGPQDGPPVVLPHGTPFSSYVWHEIAPALAAPGRTRRGRRRSTGRSPRPTSVTPTRSRACTPRWPCPSPSAGARRHLAPARPGRGTGHADPGRPPAHHPGRRPPRPPGRPGPPARRPVHVPRRLTRPTRNKENNETKTGNESGPGGGTNLRPGPDVSRAGDGNRTRVASLED